ncbi:MAG: HAD-IC family P-type ATPase, partial [Intestinibacter bartlettii]|nr:HAD-IC family P-type ATPase [Intestinibacter bartlettii]
MNVWIACFEATQDSDNTVNKLDVGITPTTGKLGEWNEHSNDTIKKGKTAKGIMTYKLQNDEDVVLKATKGADGKKLGTKTIKLDDLKTEDYLVTENLTVRQLEQIVSELNQNDGKEKKKSLFSRIADAFVNPFTIILFCLALVSCVTDMILPYFSLFGSNPDEFNCLTVVIIVTMVVISGTLRFVQESRSGDAAEKLLDMITTTCTVTRKEEGKQEIKLDEVVVGDIVYLSAGDMIPADVRILEAKDLFVSQASLTGESEPIEKLGNIQEKNENITEYNNIAFMGSNIISGTATAVVVSVGDSTLFGKMAASVAEEAVETSFTKGVNAVSWVLIRFMLILVPVVFFVNGITKGDWLNAFLFGISIAVGLT